MDVVNSEFKNSLNHVDSLDIKISCANKQQ